MFPGVAMPWPAAPPMAMVRSSVFSSLMCFLLSSARGAKCGAIPDSERTRPRRDRRARPRAPWKWWRYTDASPRADVPIGREDWGEPDLERSPDEIARAVDGGHRPL